MKNTGLVIGIVVIVILAVLLVGGAGMMGLGGFGMMGPGMTFAPHCAWCSAGVGGYGGMHGTMHGYGAQGFGYNPFGAILSLALWALVIGGVVLLVVWLARSGGRTLSGASSSDPALEILRTRYARGEITKEQFDAIKHDLGA